MNSETKKKGILQLIPPIPEFRILYAQWLHHIDGKAAPGSTVEIYHVREDGK